MQFLLFRCATALLVVIPHAVSVGSFNPQPKARTYAGSPRLRLRVKQNVSSSPVSGIYTSLPTPAARPDGEGDGMAKHGNRRAHRPPRAGRVGEGDSSAMWADRGRGSISFTIRTSRMGSVTALVASRSRSILFTIRTSRMGSVTALVASLAAPSCSPSARGGWGLDCCVQRRDSMTICG